MRRFSAIIADDEHNVRDDIARMLARLWPELEIAAVADNGAQAVDLLTNLSPDIAFLDIRMPIHSGMEVANYAGPDCRLVFITAYDNYAVDAFDRAAIDYLLKPVQEHRLQETIDRLKKSLTAGKSGTAHPLGTVPSAKEEPHPPLKWLRVAQGNDVVILSMEDIIYFRAEDKYTTVVTKERSFLIRTPVNELEQRLDQSLYWRIHRGIIVNVRQILRVHKSINGRRLITLKDRKETLTSSRSYRHLFDQM